MKRLLLALSITLCAMLQTCEPVFAGNKEIRTQADLNAAIYVAGASVAGDTLWLYTNTYRMLLEPYVSGTASNYIVLRPKPGHAPIIDNGGLNESHYVKGNYLEYRTLEFTNTNPNPGRSEGGINAAASIDFRLIDCYIHDVGTTCVSPFWEATGTLIAECVFKNYGRYDNAADPGNGYGIYGQNKPGKKKTIRNVISWEGFGIYSGHLQGSDQAPVHDFDIDGVVWSGYPLYNGKTPWWIIGNFETGAGKNTGIVFRNSYAYRGSLDLGYHGEGLEQATFTNNTIVAGTVVEHGSNTYAAKSGNTIVPTLDRVIVRLNPYRDQYTKNRATIIVYNSSNAASVSVPIPAGLLAVGERYDLIDTQNMKGVWSSGVYAGGNLIVQMPNESSPYDVPVSIPASRQAGSLPAHQDGRFNVFRLHGPIGAVAPAPQPLPLPTGAINAVPLQLTGPGSVQLSWSSLNATTATIDNGIGAVSPNGTRVVNVTASTVFRITLTGGGGTTSYSVGVTVNPVVPPPQPAPAYDAVTVLGVTFLIRKACPDTTIYVPVRIQKP